MFSSGNTLDTKGTPVENIRVEPKMPAYVPSQQEIMVDTMQKKHIPQHVPSSHHHVTHEYVYENNYYVRPPYYSYGYPRYYWREVPDRTSVGNDPVTIFFMGSLTVVGLYALFRMINKK